MRTSVRVKAGSVSKDSTNKMLTARNAVSTIFSVGEMLAVR